MAPRTLNPNELIEVVWADTQQMVTLPRHLTAGASKAAQERHLIATGQIIDPNAPAMPEMQEPQQIIRTVVDTAALAGVERRLQALERQPVPVLPSEESLAQWAIAAQRVGLSHQELAALVEQTTSSCEATAAAAQARLDGLDARQAALVEQVSSTLSETQAAVADSLSAASQQLATFESEVEAAALAKAEAVARKQVGPQGFPGSSTVIAMEDPLEVDPSSFSTRWLGRSLVDGDGVLVVKPDEILVRRYVRGQWQTGPSIEPKVVAADVKVSALDASTKLTTLVSGGGGNSGLGGGGGESLLSRTVASGGSAMLSESARWAIPLAAAGLPAPDACTVTLELTAADGGNAGKKLFITGKVLYEGLATPPSSFTVYSELGELVGRVTVDVTIQSAPAVLPPGLPAVTIPPGVVSYQLFASISSNATGATQFLLAGAVSWMQPNAVIPGSSTTPPQIVPAWSLV